MGFHHTKKHRIFSHQWEKGRMVTKINLLQLYYNLFYWKYFWFGCVCRVCFHSTGQCSTFGSGLKTTSLNTPISKKLSLICRYVKIFVFIMGERIYFVLFPFTLLMSTYYFVFMTVFFPFVIFVTLVTKCK